MEKKAFLFLMIVSSTWSLLGQTNQFCGSSVFLNEQIQLHPEIIQDQNQLEQFTQQWIAGSQPEQDVVYTIPVVFHIIHDNGPENISDSQVIDAMIWINRDFSKQNPDTINTLPIFQSIATNCYIKFVLANNDPNGNCTNGIEHVLSKETYVGGETSKLHDWPRNKYLNIWIVKAIVNPSNAAAYSTFPGSANFDPTHDGVICRADYCGGTGLSSSSHGHTLSHEIGHFLNLQHPWGNNNSPGVACGDDQVTDTPETKGWTSCNLSGSICNQGVIENVQNFMDYSYCETMFTTGQKTRMRAALNSSTAQRNQLWTTSNLTATGVSTNPPNVCTPVADFKASRYMICQGDMITFTDLSWNATPTAWSWNLADGTPATSNAQNPDVVFNTPGWKTISMTSSTSAGNNSITKTSFIYVSAPGISTLYPFHYDFEDVSQWTNNFQVFNFYQNTSKWTYTTGVGFASNACVKLNNYGNVLSDVDAFVTPPVNLSGLTSIGLNFKLSAASKTSPVSNSADQLRIYSSTDCGKNWALRKIYTGTELSNAGYVGTTFTPTQTQQWVDKTWILPPSLAVDNVRFKIEVSGGDGGNNIYIDNINIGSSSVGIDNIQKEENSFHVFPNPASGTLQIEITNFSEAQTEVAIYNSIGQLLINENVGRLSSGIQILPMDISSLGSGIYLIQVTQGGVKQQQIITVL